MWRQEEARQETATEGPYVRVLGLEDSEKPHLIVAVGYYMQPCPFCYLKPYQTPRLVSDVWGVKREPLPCSGQSGEGVAGPCFRFCGSQGRLALQQGERRH